MHFHGQATVQPKIIREQKEENVPKETSKSSINPVV